MIAILLATYNGEKYLNDLLISLENQTYKNWGLYVIDDNSEDSTLELLYQYKKETLHAVEIYHNSKRTGSPKKNFFKLLRRCEDSYAMFCDQDDVWMPDKIKESINAIKQLEDDYGKEIPLLVHTDLKVVNKNLKIIDGSFYHYSRYKKNGNLNLQLCLNEIPGCTMLLNKKLIQLCKRELETDRIMMHDSWVALIAHVMGKVKYIDEGLILYRQHHDNSLGAADANNLAYKIKRILNRKQLKTENREHVKEVSYFFNCYGQEINDNNIKKMLEEYSRLGDCGIISYIFICIKYKILKYPVSRAFFQLISGC